MTYYIGIAGKAGCGKDTLAGMIEATATLLGYDPVVIMGFADPIRHIAKWMGYSMDRDHKEVPVLKHFCRQDYYDAFSFILPNTVGMLTIGKLVDRAANVIGTGSVTISPRQFMQKLGTEVGQSISKTFWVDLLYQRKASGNVVLITDLRFPHEVDKLDGIIYVDRDVVSVASHVSESHFAEIKKLAGRVVTNNGTRLDLLKQAVDLLEYINEPEANHRAGQGASNPEGSEGHCTACKECGDPECKGWHIGEHPCTLVGEAGRGVQPAGGNERG